MRARRIGPAHLSGAQEMDSFWERVIQRVVAVMLARFGGTES